MHYCVQLNLSTTATLGTESGHCREVAVVERWPLVQVQMYCHLSHFIVAQNHYIRHYC